MTPTLGSSAGDSAFIASINDDFTRMFEGYNKPLRDNFTLAVSNWQLNDPIYAAEQKTNPLVLRPPFPTPPMLKRVDLAIVDQIFVAYQTSMVNGLPAVLDISPAITTYQMPYTPPSAPVAIPPPANPIGPEEGVGSGVYNDKDGDPRVNGDVFYLFGIPMRLHVIQTMFGFSRFFVIDWTAPPPPTPNFTGDAAK